MHMMTDQTTFIVACSCETQDCPHDMSIDNETAQAYMDCFWIDLDARPSGKLTVSDILQTAMHLRNGNYRDSLAHPAMATAERITGLALYARINGAETVAYCPHFELGELTA